MSKGFGIKRAIAQTKLKIGTMPSPDECWMLFHDYENDKSKEPEFRCIAGVCIRQPMLELLCNEIEVSAPSIAAIAFTILFNLPCDGITESDRSNFAAFRKVLRDRLLPLWIEQEEIGAIAHE